MLNLGTLFKAAKSGMDPETLKPMLEALGFKLDMQPVDIRAHGPEALRTLAAQAGRRGASLHRLTGTMKSGGTLEALIVLVPESQEDVSTVTAREKLAA